MRVGVPKEIKAQEYRVGMTPSGAKELVLAGHQVLVETGAGRGSGFSDEQYLAAGALILPEMAMVYEGSDLIVKVKEPQAIERKMLTPAHTLFTYLHLAPDRAQTDDLLASGATCIAYETVTAANGFLPLLAPMSEVAGRLSVQVGAAALQKSGGGKGLLLGGVAGVLPAQVLILGGGVVGTQAAVMAVGLGADVTVLDKSPEVLAKLDARFGGRVKTLYATRDAIDQRLLTADLVIGAVLIPGGQAPRLIQRHHLAQMQPGTVLVDVAIDQGGCFETSRPTTHDQPTYVVDNVVHYCVANMPAAVPMTSTRALTNVTLPFVLALANEGVSTALEKDPNLASGLSIRGGRLLCERVAKAQQRSCG